MSVFVFMKINKKADMSIQTVVVAVLALLVLLVLIFIFYQQMSGANSNFKFFRERASTEYCMSLGFTRQCKPSCDTGWQPVSPTTYCDKKLDASGNCPSDGKMITGFRDCKTSTNGGSDICCEKVGEDVSVTK